jgi:predicted nuclease of predicted toxin-antitoxin system
VADHLAFLVDENLTPVLAEMAQERGYHAMHATWVRLRGRRDHQVASYAVNNNMILVTNDMSDFRRIYRRRKLHPGIVFLAVMDSGIMDRDAQTFMFEAALENVEEDEPINEAVQAQLDENEDGDWVVTVSRYPLPRS